MASVEPQTDPPTVTYGIIGVGLMGMEHIRNLLRLDHARVVAVADDHPDSLSACSAALREEAPAVAASLQLFPSADALFRAQVCQVAIVSTPNHTHHAVLTSAYRLADPAMHVLVEKPLCTTIEHCRDVTAAAAQRTGTTFVGLEYCYMPPVARLIADVAAGKVGPPVMAAIREHRFPFLRKVRDWNRFNCNSGGTFVEKCCHFFDLFNRILRPEQPVAVLASGGQDVNHLDEVYDGKRSDIMDNGFVVIEYTGGRRAMLDLCMFAEASNSQEEVSVVGPKGKVEAFLPQLEVRTGIRGEHACGNVKIEIVNDDRIQYEGHHHGSSYLEHMDVLKMVQAGGKNGVDAEGIATAGTYQGLVSVAIGLAAQLSIEEKRRVLMTEIVTKDELEKCFESL